MGVTIMDNDDKDGDDNRSLLLLFIILIRVSSLFFLVLLFQVAMTRLSLENESKRRWQHAITGHLLVQISYVLPLLVSIGALVVGAIGIAYIRWVYPILYIQVFGSLLRSEEIDKERQRRLPGAFYFLCGTAITAAIYPLKEARYAVECLSFADPMASWIGQLQPIPKFHTKASVAGCTACFVTAYLIGLLYLETESTTTTTTGLVSTKRQVLVGALACMVAEALPFGNDNLLIPIVTGAAVTYLRD